MNRRDFLLGLITLTITNSLSCRPATKMPRKPNILFILVDQQRQDGIGAYGTEQVQTPNLDKMAREGIRFNRAYVAQPLCAPNRGSIFSGLYPFNHGVRENTWNLSTDVKLLPHFLAEEGYQTAYFGKWHLGDKARSAFQTMPPYENDGRGDGHYFQRNGESVYQTIILADDAIAFMTENKENPFFAVVSINPPHPPFRVPQEYKDIYQNVFPEDSKRRHYYGMCTAVDAAVERILGSLKKLDLEQDTLVIYTSDHGHFFEKRWNNYEKRLCYDEVSKIPLLMKFPKLIQSRQVSQMLINSVDLTPTILGLIGISTSNMMIDGMDLSSVISGKSDQIPNYTVFINVPFTDDSNPPPFRPMLEKGEERCIVHKNWKLILSTVRLPELYNLEADPLEKQNLWEGEKKHHIIDLLAEYLSEWAHKTKDELTPQLLQHL